MNPDRSCPVCGRPVVPSAAYCPTCGAQIPVHVAARPGPLVGFAPATVSPAAVSEEYSSHDGPLPGHRLGPVDVQAMDALTVAAVLGLVGLAVIWIAPEVFGYAFVGFPYSSSSLTGNLLRSLIPVAAIGGSVAVAQYVFYRIAFGRLAPVDRGIRGPSAWSTCAIVGGILLTLSGSFFLYALIPNAACLTSMGAGGGSCFSSGVVASIGVLLVGGLVALVGIVAIWLGLWRLGTRYDEILFKAGMVLSIFPIVDLAGFVLILIGARLVRSRAMRTASSTVPGPIPPPSA